MASDLQRIVQGLLDCLDDIPGIVALLRRTAARLRDDAALVVALAGADTRARDVALELDAVARACDEAVEKASQAPAIARPWAERTLAELGDGSDASVATRGDRRQAGSGERHESGDRQARQTIELDLGSAGDDDPADGPDAFIELSSTDPNDRAALNNPPPNSTIEVDGRFTYRTDQLGRVVHASTTLTVVDPKHPRDRTAQRIFEGKLDGDHAGHIFARIFEGPAGRVNLTPMEGRKVNLSAYRVIENIWKDALTKKKEVDVEVTLSYASDTHRPDYIGVRSSIDGVVTQDMIRNTPRKKRG